MIKIFSVPVLLSLLILSAKGQDSIKKIKVLPVPVLGYSPETKTYVGAFALFTFNLYPDQLTRTSNAKVEFNYSWNRQLIFDSSWNYFFKEEKWFTKGRLNYADYPDSYYGIGSNTQVGNKVLFSSKKIIFEANMLKKVGNGLFIGPYVRYLNYYDLSSDENLSFPELTDTYSSGAGLTLLSDSRNNILTPEKGFYFNLSAGYNFSKNNFRKISVDTRYYKTWSEKITWANRLYGEFHSGTPPFFDYSFLGGDLFVRGFNYGRYRDNNLTTWQTEVRFPIVWRIGMAAFGGVSDLYNDKLLLNKLKYNGGAGIRILVDKRDRTNLRLDYAIGSSSNSGFYVAFGESF